MASDQQMRVGAEMRRRVLVTGASGFVARALLTQNVAGYEFVPSSRKIAAGNGQWTWRRSPDLSALADWGSLLEGIDSVVHLAGRVHLAPDNDPTAYFVENCDGTLKLARDAISAGVRRFVFLSTAKIYGDESGATPFSESSPASPGDSYAASKLSAEMGLSSLSDQLQVSVLRPPLVYGPGVKANFLALLSAVARGVPMPLASIRNRRSLISVANLASAIVACLESSKAGVGTYCVTDGLPLSTPDMVRALASALGKPSRLFSFPPRLLEGCGSLIGRGETIRRLTRSLELNDREIREELRWCPSQTFASGIAETVKWYEEAAQENS
jgi:nucleoside-diphosphate-sugar epimerase